MIKVTLKRPKKDEREREEDLILTSFLFPTNASEIPYKQYVKFEEAFEAKERWMQEMEAKEVSVSSPAYLAGFILHTAHVVEAFTGEKSVAQIAVGKYLERVGKEYQHDEEKLKEEMRSTEQTMMTLYSNIWHTLSSYKKVRYARGDFRFEYKGEKYKISSLYRDAITNQLRFEGLTTAQAVEALDALRVYQQHEENDPGKKFLFTTVLKLVACLALKKGESFPDTETEIQKWVSSRIRFFEDVDMQVALNVRDFFFGTTNPLPKTLVSDGSLTHPRPPEKRGKHGRSSRRRTRRQ